MSTGTEPTKNPAEGQDAAGGDKKIVLTQEQLDEMIEKRLARDRKEVKSKLQQFDEEKSALQRELEEAREALKNAPKGSDEAKAAADNIETIKNELDEVKRANKKLLDEKSELGKSIDNLKKQGSEKDQQMLELRKQTAMQFAINKLPFIDPEAVLEITKKNVKYDTDTNEFIVLNEKGGPRYNPQGELMNLDEYYLDFIQQKKFWARSDAISGLGSSENKGGLAKDRIKVEEVFGPKSDAKKANQLKRTDPNRYAELKKSAQEQKLI